jgi:hypothetical protein
MSDLPPNNAPKLFLSPPSDHRITNPSNYGLTGPLGKLAAWLGLDVHGPIGLSRCAAIEMKFAAFLLVVIFAFDCLAWTLLWNVVFNKGLLDTNRYTFFAFIAGLIFAMATLVYERQFLTMDTSDRKLGIVLGVSMRVAVLAGAAYATSQPIKLLWFNGPIQERIHEESVRHRAAGKLSTLEETLKNARLSGLATIGVKERRRDTQVSFNDAKTERVNAENELKRQQGIVKGLDGRIDALRRITITSEGQRRWRDGQIADAQEKRRKAVDEVDRQQKVLGIKQEAENRASEQVNLVEQTVTTTRANAAIEAKRLLDWVSQLQTGTPGEPQTEKAPPRLEGKTEPEPAWEYAPSNYDFFQRLRILDDLKSGRPAQWKDVTPEDRRKLINTFKIKDSNPNPDDAAEQAMRTAAAERAMTIAREQNKKDEEVEEAGRRAEHEIVLAIEGMKTGTVQASPIEPEIMIAGRQARRDAEAANERVRIDAQLFSDNYRVAYIIALAIPLLVFAMKLIMGRELRNYYSSDYQRRAGNYQSVVFDEGTGAEKAGLGRLLSRLRAQLAGRDKP